MQAGAFVENFTIRDVRVSALSSVAPVVMRAVKTEEVLRAAKITLETGAAAKEALAGEIAPIDDIRSTTRYRLRIAQNLLEEFLAQLAR